MRPADPPVLDPLTGLTGPGVLREHIDELLEEGPPVVVLAVDLDGFNALTERLSRNAGDELLRHVARRLTRAVRPGDLVARERDDDFVIVLQGGDDGPHAARRVTARVLDALRAPHLIAGDVVHATATIGAATSPADGTTSAALLAAAWSRAAR